MAIRILRGVCSCFLRRGKVECTMDNGWGTCSAPPLANRPCVSLLTCRYIYLGGGYGGKKQEGRTCRRHDQRRPLPGWPTSLSAWHHHQAPCGEDETPLVSHSEESSMCRRLHQEMLPIS